MNFNKKNIRRKIKKTYTFNKSIFRKKDNGKSVAKFIKYGLIGFIAFSTLLILILFFKIIKDLPSIKELENLEIAESTTIYDREGGELYKIFKEKRTYVAFEEINKNMLNAIVAGEDKRYWENSGIDFIGLLRAVFYRIIGKSEKLEATSTLTQQLVKNTVLSSERKIERKIKEIYLSFKLSASVSKEKILELYLNKISYGHNAYGIEQAAKTFFGKSAIELDILESSILASLPKGPTYYSPYNHPDRSIGYLYYYNKNSEDNIKEIQTYSDKENQIEIVNKFSDFIKNLKTTKLEGTTKGIICGISKENFKIDLRIDNDGCSVLEYSKLLNFLNGIKIENGEEFIEYQTGRKDFILGRMLEDGYISFDEYKNAIINSIGFKFNELKEEIKAPHFIFYIKEYLEKKYGEDIVESGGLKVYTTIDPKLQEKAEEIVEKQSKINKERFDAANSALISIDNKTGEIIAMVGSNDYFDKENKGNVNIITSKLQPGSSFKPFVYSLGMYNQEIGSKSPIYDLKTEFPSSYIPSNFDGSFMGKMNISTALNSSRNIPAIKMFYMAGGEKAMVNFMQKLGVKSLNSNGNYGAPLALGTGEMTPLELASAYNVYANMGEKKEIVSILKIIDGKGNIIEEHKENKGEQVISKSQAYINNYILSDSGTRPETWNHFLTISDRKIAAKTGTSTKQYVKNGKKEKFPANLWTIGYTPNYTTVTWAGNTNGSQTNMKGDGLNAAGPIMRDFMEFAHKGKKAEFWSEPNDLIKINISEISGLLPNPENETNSNLIESMFINKPSSYDNSFKKIKVDILCNGKISEKTPEAAIREVELVQLHSLSPTNPNWENPVLEWTKSEAFKTRYGNIANLVTEVNENTCERSLIPSNIIIKTIVGDNETFSKGENYIEFAYTSNNPLVKAEILLDGNVVDEIDLYNKKEGAYLGNFNIPASYSNKKVNFSIRALDKEYYSSSSESTQIIILEKDITPPVIELVNPIDGSIKLYEDTFFNLKANISDRSNIRTINIRLDGKTIKAGLTDKKLEYPINTEKNLSVGNHIIQIEAIDNGFNKVTSDIKLEILPR